MKKRHVFSLCLTGEDIQAAKVSVGEDRPYAVEWLETVPTQDQALTRQMKELCSPGSRVFQGLPNEEVSLLITALPPMKRKQMAVALQGVLQRDKGGRPEEWVVDYQELPERDTAGPHQVRNDISGLFIRKLVLEHLYGQAKDLGVRPKGLIPGYLALDLLFRRHRPEGISGEVWNLVYLGQDEKFLCVGDDHCLLFTRPLPADLSDGGAKEEYVERLAAEIERSNFFAQQAERSLQVESIVVCGDPGLSLALVAKMSEMSGFEVVDWRIEELFSPPGGSASWEHVLPLATAAAAFHAAPYNLLPQEVQESHQRTARRLTLTSAATFGMAVVPLLLVGSLWTNNVQNRYLKSAEQEMTRAEWRASEAATAYLHDRVLNERQVNVETFSSDLPDLAALLRDIAVRTPSTVVYLNLDLREDIAGQHRLILQGESIARDGTRAHETFLKFLAALNDCQRIRLLREPTYLEISGLTEGGPPQSRVLFTMEYEIIQGGAA